MDVGTYYRDSWQPGIRRNVINFRVHPKFQPHIPGKPDRFDFDVAVLLLDAPLPATVRPIELPAYTRGWACFVQLSLGSQLPAQPCLSHLAAPLRAAKPAMPLAPGSQLLAAGWGRVDKAGGLPPNGYLRQVCAMSLNGT